MAQFRDAAIASLPGLRARHPAILARPMGDWLWSVAVVSAMVALAVGALWHFEFSPARMRAGLNQLGTFIPLMFPPDPGSWAKASLFLHALFETIAIAFLGTLLAALVAFPIGFIAARNTTVHRVVRFASRRVLDSIRGVDALIWALIWVGVVGLGPFAGVLAIMTSDIGAFGKLFSEAIEAVDKKPQEGVTASGGSDLHRIRFGVLPQVLPVIAGQVLYYFESNTRSSTIIGIVGAGGIGLHLSEMIRTLEWQAVSFIVLLVLVTVAVIDAISTRLRLSIIGRQALVR